MAKAISTKKRGALIACSALMAVALTGGLACIGSGVTAHADGEDPAPAYTPKLYYYVDAGNFVRNDNAEERFPGRDSIDTKDTSYWGVPHSHETNFMKAYGLHYGTKDGAGEVTGLYNSVADNQLKEDEKTGKTWGVDPTNYGWDKWRVLTTNSTNTLYDGYQTGRHSEGTEFFTYKFEVDDATTPLKITIGARSYDNGGWGPKDYNYQINKLTPVQIHAPASDDAEQVSSDLWANEKITGVKEGEGDDAKYFVTLTIGKDSDCNAYLNWIMIATDNYELPVAYTLPTFVKSDATTVTATPSDGSGAIEATITDNSQEALAAAAPLSDIDITVNVGGGKTATSKVTVIPASTKYFVNVGDEDGVNTYGGVMGADGAYSAANGYGYLSEGSKPHGDKKFPGSAQWKPDPYNISCRADMDTIVYQFDVTGKSYAVILGVVEHWAQYPITGGRKSEFSVNGGAGTLLTLPIQNDASVKGTAYGDAVGGKLNVKIDTKCSEANVIAYILVYEHEHSGMTSHEAVTATCEHGGNDAYYQCSVCGQKYSNEEGTSAYVEHAQLSHNGTHHEADPATCQAAGTLEYWSCSAGCNKNYSDADCTNVLDSTVDPQKDHSKTHHEAVAATCLAAGNVEYWSCENGCGKNYSDADCTNVLDNIVVAQLSHNGTHHEAVDATCLAAGNVEYWSCDKGCNKNYSDSNCTSAIDNVVIAKLSHNTTHHEADPATCQAAGTLEYWSCSAGCGKNYSDAECTNVLDSTVDPQKDHSKTHHEAVAATCLAAGNVEYWSCENGCGKNYSDANCTTVLDSIVDPQKDHSKTHHEADPATCLAAGTLEYWSCENGCGKNYSDADCTNVLDSTVDPQKDHSKTHHEAVAESCTTDGSIEYWSCENGCGKNYSDADCTTELEEEIVIPAHHTYDAEHIQWTWTENSDGWTCTYSATCTVCSTPADAQAATVTSKVTTAATCITDGVRTYTAKAGNVTYDITKTKVIPATNHANKTSHEEVAATCVEAGTKAYWSCPDCGKNFAEEACTNELTDLVIPALGHHGVHHAAVAATCTTAGTGEYWSCDRGCGKNYSDEACTNVLEAIPTVAALGHDTKIEWSWTGTTAATAKVTCKRDGCTESNTITATITSEVTKEATKSEEGETTYTATIKVGDKTYTDTKTEPIEKKKSGGCSGAIGGTAGAFAGLSIVCLGAVCAVIFARKKKNN